MSGAVVFEMPRRFRQRSQALGAASLYFPAGAAVVERAGRYHVVVISRRPDTVRRLLAGISSERWEEIPETDYFSEERQSNEGV